MSPGSDPKIIKELLVWTALPAAQEGVGGWWAFEREGDQPHPAWPGATGTSHRGAPTPPQGNLQPLPELRLPWGSPLSIRGKNLWMHRHPTGLQGEHF